MPEKDQNKFNNDERIEQIYELILRYTTSDFSLRGTISNKGDELDAIIVGLNTLGEELQSSGKQIRQFNERINGLMDVLLHQTLMDFSVKAEVTEAGDELDAIAVGLNTLAEELISAKNSEELSKKEIELKATELESVNKELEAFAYSVSHDLRSPLRAIHGYTKILLEDYQEKFDPDGKNMMDSILRNAKKMGQLIDDLLAFSRIGRAELKIGPTDMNQLVRNTLEDVKAATPDFKAKVTILPLDNANADVGLIGLVLTNLISNAVKYSSSKSNSEITIKSEKLGKEVVYSITDNGVGFDMKYYNKLFGVFQRLHSAEEFEGTGVGLALVQRIIARHGGRIWAEAKPNEGATFYFTLN